MILCPLDLQQSWHSRKQRKAILQMHLCDLHLKKPEVLMNSASDFTRAISSLRIPVHYVLPIETFPLSDSAFACSECCPHAKHTRAPLLRSQCHFCGADFQVFLSSTVSHPGIRSLANCKNLASAMSKQNRNSLTRNIVFLSTLNDECLSITGINRASLPVSPWYHTCITIV